MILSPSINFLVYFVTLANQQDAKNDNAPFSHPLRHFFHSDQFIFTLRQIFRRGPKHYLLFALLNSIH